jgi:hypothetical protein
VLLAILLSSLIGVSLGLLGGGGSILTIPVLVYVLGVPAKTAIPMSLVVVGVTSAVAAFTHFRAGRVAGRTALAFAPASMAGAFLGGRVAGALPGEVLLVLLAGLMLATAVAMLRGRRGPVADTRLSPGKAAATGAVLGVVTGTVGAGGGFLIVPALVLVGGLAMHRAVGTSLAIIAMNSAAALAGHLGHASLDWGLTAAITGAAVAGSLAGGALSPRVPQEALRRGFGVFVVAMAGVLLVKELPALGLTLPGAATLAALSPLLPLAGGALIGLAAALLWMGSGRIAGISGIVGGLLQRCTGDRGWRVAFIGGLLSAGIAAAVIAPGALASTLERSPGALALAGLLVGFGARLGNGCTSGHGVCGVGRWSTRSLVATAVFMGTGVLTVLFVRLVFGGVL